MTQGWAPALAAGTEGVWFAADGHHLFIHSGDALVRTVDSTGGFGGRPRPRPDGTVLAGRFAVDPASGTLTELLPVAAVLEAYDPQGDANQIVVRDVAWSEEGSALLLAEYRATRMLGGSDAAEPGLMLGWAAPGGAAIRSVDQGMFLTPGPLAADRWLVSGGASVRAFAAGNGEQRFVVQPGQVATAVATVGDLIAAGLSSGEVLTVDVIDGQQPRRRSRHEGPIDAVAISPDGALVASGDRDGDLGVWPVGGEEPVLRTTVPGRVDGLCFLAEDHLVVAVGGPEQQLRHLRLQ